jgi:hypothetical protein
MATVPSLDDFATYLGNEDLDEERAQFCLDKAQTLCESVVKPLPDGADVVVIDVAQRAYANPVPSSSGPEGPYDLGSPGGLGAGFYLTASNEQTLRHMAGSGGAFTIDTAPATVPSLPWWDLGSAVSGDWDQIPT